MRIRKRVFRNEFGRPGRLLLKGRTAVYHVINRTACRSFWLGQEEREAFRAMLYKQAAFAGVEVLTYCLMDNHFHLLLRVPRCPFTETRECLIDDATLLQRYEAFYGQRVPQSTYSVAELRAILTAGGDEATEARQKVLSRMGNLPVFMQELKQRFAIWFNDRKSNTGSIWSSVFRSVLVEDAPSVVTKVAAYIDLNPVRASLVDDPKDYAWSGYGAAMAGAAWARAGLVGLYRATGWSAEESLKAYRLVLYGVGMEGNPGARIDAKSVQEALSSGQRVRLSDVLCCHLRFFSEGRILGRQSFLKEVLPKPKSKNRETSGAPLPGSIWEALWAGRSFHR